MAFLPGFILWPLGSLIVGGITGGAVGDAIGKKHHDRRDLGDLHSAVIMFNKPAGADVAAYHGINITTPSILADTRAVLSHAGGETEGRLTGYPVRSFSSILICERTTDDGFSLSRVPAKTA